MRALLSILIFLPISLLAQTCTNQWSATLSGGTSGTKVTQAALIANTTGNGPFNWLSFNNGIALAENLNTATWTNNGPIPQVEMKFSNCNSIVTYNNSVGFDAITDNEFNWRFIPGWRGTSLVASVWLRFNGPETDSTFNMDVFTMYTVGATSNFFSNADLVSFNNSLRFGFENPGGSNSSAITGLHTQLWYKIVLAHNLRGTNWLMIYDINTNLLGTIASAIDTGWMAACANATVTNLCIGVNSAAAAAAGYHLWYYGLFVDGRPNPTFPPVMETPPAWAPTVTAACSPAQLSGGCINLTWNSSSNVSGYLIQRAVSGGSYSDIAGVSSATLSYQDTGLVVGPSYDYRVLGTNLFYSSNSVAVTSNAFCFRPGVGSPFNNFTLR